MHRSRIALIVIDVPEGDRTAAETFWSRLTQRSVRTGTKYPEYSVLQPTRDVGLLVQAIGGESRYHLDLHTDDLAAECRRVEALGASEVYRQDSWVVFEAPGGLLLCVVGVPPDDPSLEGAQEFEDDPPDRSVAHAP